MILHHTTLLAVASKIMAEGLKGSFSRGAKRVVWLHSPSNSWWAVQHVCLRHDAHPEHIVRMTVDVPRSWLRRSRRGLWYCVQDIPPERIRGFSTYAMVLHDVPQGGQVRCVGSE